jgi:hypothetical protein
MDTFEGNLTLDVISVIYAVCSGYVVISVEIISQVHVPVNYFFKGHWQELYFKWFLIVDHVQMPLG